jgi:hypothetical protein
MTTSIFFAFVTFLLFLVRRFSCIHLVYFSCTLSLFNESLELVELSSQKAVELLPVRSFGKRNLGKSFGMSSIILVKICDHFGKVTVWLNAFLAVGTVE